MSRALSLAVTLVLGPVTPRAYLLRGAKTNSRWRTANISHHGSATVGNSSALVLDTPHNTGSVMTDSAPPGMDFVMYDTDGSMYRWLQTPGEHFVQDAFHESLRRNCRKDSSPEDAWNNTVLDIGSNTGFFGLLALKYGCAVAFVDPQPYCMDLVRKSISANKFDSAKFRIIAHPLGADADAGKVLQVQPLNRCEGRFPIVNLERGHEDAFGANSSVAGDSFGVNFLPAAKAVQSLPLPQGATILMAKIDTEGNELRILEGLKPIFTQMRVLNIMVEITPMWWKHTGYTRSDGAHIFAELGALGFQGRTVQRASFAEMDTPEKIKSYVLYDDIYQDDLWLHRPSP